MTAPLDQQTKRLRAMTPAGIADKVGALKAAIAEIDEELEALKLECVRRDLLKAQGLLFDITLSPPGERKSLDKDALVADLGAEVVEQRYTKTTIGTSWTLRCTARKQRRIEAAA
jgi:hypothetical protein